MKTETPETVTLGELVSTVFDKAAHYSRDPQEVSRLATRTVAHMLSRARNLTVSRPS